MKKSVIVLAAAFIVVSSLLSSCKVTETRCPAYSKNSSSLTIEKRS